MMASLRTSRIVPAVLTLSLAVTFSAPAAIGCAFHNAIPETQLEAMYPGSIAVAVALRKAADSGDIDLEALEGAASGTLSYTDTMRRLHQFAMALAASQAVAELPSSFSLGYVESRLWARFSYSEGRVRVEVHTSGPADGEAVLLTGEAALMELRSGRLSVHRALADGLVFIDATESDTRSLRDALIATSHGERIGSGELAEIQQLNDKEH